MKQSVPRTSDPNADLARLLKQLIRRVEILEQRVVQPIVVRESDLPRPLDADTLDGDTATDIIATAVAAAGAAASGAYDPAGTAAAAVAVHVADTTAHPAANITVASGVFVGNLSILDTDVQTALETIDALVIPTQYTDEMARDAVGAALVEGTGIDIVVNDPADTITITCDPSEFTAASVPVAAVADFAETVRDTMGTALIEGTGIDITVNDPGDTITVACDPSEFTAATVPAASLASGTMTGPLSISGSSPARPVVSGTTHFVLPGVACTAPTTLALAVNRRHFMPIYVLGSSIKVDQLAFEVTTGVAASTARIGLMAADESWQPTSVLIDSGDLSTAGTGVITYTPGAAVTLTPGPYLLVLQPTAVIAVRVMRGSPINTPIPTTLGANSLIKYFYKAGMVGALDLTAYDTISNGATPFEYMVFVRISDPSA